MFKLFAVLGFISLGVSSSATNRDGIANHRREYPTRVLAGVTVVDTPLVRSALDYAKAHSGESLYNHVVRSWLFGALIVSHNATLQSSIDLELHAVATVLHDLGLDLNNPDLVSKDKRFEVDGAFAATSFVEKHADGKKWDKQKVQLVWDSIALHTEPSFALFKEPVVQLVFTGTQQDFFGPAQGVTKEEYAKVLKDFPKGDILKTMNETVIWLCHNKPQTTWGKLTSVLSNAAANETDTWQQTWGDRFVKNYTAQRPTRYDQLLAAPVV